MSYLECKKCKYVPTEDEHIVSEQSCPVCDNGSGWNVLEEDDVIKEYNIQTSITYTYETKVRATSVEEAETKLNDGKYISREVIDSSEEGINNVDVETIYSKNNEPKYIIREDLIISKYFKIKPDSHHYQYKYIGYYIDELGRHRHIFKCLKCGVIKACAFSTIREAYSFRHFGDKKCKVHKQNTIPEKILKEIEIHFND